MNRQEYESVRDHMLGLREDRGRCEDFAEAEAESAGDVDLALEWVAKARKCEESAYRLLEIICQDSGQVHMVRSEVEFVYARNRILGYSP